MFGELVKSLVVRFSSENYQLVKEEIDSIPDEKRVKVVLDVDKRMFSSALLAAVADARSRIQAEARTFDLLNPDTGGGGNWFTRFLARLAFRGFGRINTPGPGSLPSFFTSIPGLAAVAVAASAALTEVDMLVSGFAAATAGVGAFALVALPTFKTVTGAVSQIAADTLAYQRATTAAAKSDALQKIKADWAALDPAQRQAVKSIQAFQAAWAALAQKFEPQALKLLADALKVAGNMFGPIATLARAAFPAIDGLLKDLGKFTASQGFKDWIAQFSKISGPAITAIGHGIGDVVTNFGKLLTIFSAKDVVMAINFAFRLLSGAIHAVGVVIQWSKNAWDWIMKTIPGAKTAVDALKFAWQHASVVGGDFRHALDNVGHAAGNVEHAFDNFQHALGNVRHAWDNVSHAIDNFRHATDNVVHAIGNVIHAFGNIGHAAANVWRAILWLSDHIRTFFTVDIPHWISNAVSWFHSLPGKIVGALSSLPGLLFSAGAHIISSLISGLQSRVGTLMSVVHTIAGIVAGFFPNSPAKHGPFSGAGAPELRGAHISWALSQGMLSNLGMVSAASLRVANAAVPGAGRYGHPGAGASGGITINVTVSPGTAPNETARAIQKILLNLKRTNGGGALGLA